WQITLTSLHGNRRRSSDGSFNFGGGTQAYCPAKKKRNDFDTYSEGGFSDRTLSPNENERHRANAMAQEEEDSLPPGLDETMKFSLGEQGQSLSPVVPLLLTSGEVNPEDVFGGRDSLASLASFGEGSIPAIRPSTPAANPR
ncbi:Mediator of DNA damage checkpoint protein 1, partial [Perkinsus olseni]